MATAGRDPSRRHDRSSVATEREPTSGWSPRTMSAASMSERSASSPRRSDVDMPCAESGLKISSAAPSTALATSFDAYTTTTW